jgi:hypothetical protein
MATTATTHGVQPPSGKGKGGDKHRSPEYPMFDLETALARARVLYDKEKLLPVPVIAAMGHFGYTAKSSGGMRTVAALLHFGLLVEEGKGTTRRVRLSELARDILLDRREDSPERQAKIREAAIRPRMHAEVASAWEHLPSAETLELELVRRFGFNPDMAAGFADEVRRTFTFAKLGDGATVSPSLADKGKQPPAPPADDGKGRRPADPPRRPGMRTIQLPYSADAWATLEAAFPITPEAWEQLMAVLVAMKPALAVEPPPATASGGRTPVDAENEE